MLPKKPPLFFLFPYSGSLCHASAPTCTFSYQTSCRYPPSSRSHAHNASSSSRPIEPDLSWPAAAHPHRTPTPYQILQCSPGHVYTKHRFYSLVKLYHPDCQSSASPVAHLPHAVRTERYRLLVAAHAILSDDAKRKAYDACGYGWQGHHHTPSYNEAYAWHPQYRQWPPDHDPQHNATWEDWERWHRWHQRQDSAPQEEPRDPLMTNFAFVALIFSIVSLGGVLQGTRANLLTSSAMEHHDRIHREASIELARSKRATISGDREERIKSFLENRQAILDGEDSYQRLLPPSETCTPDTVRKQ